MTLTEQLALIERDRLALLARLEAERLLEPSPPVPGATMSVLAPPLIMREAEVEQRLKNWQRRQDYRAAYAAHAAEQARLRRQRAQVAA